MTYKPTKYNDVIRVIREILYRNQIIEKYTRDHLSTHQNKFCTLVLMESKSPVEVPIPTHTVLQTIVTRFTHSSVND